MQLVAQVLLGIYLLGFIPYLYISIKSISKAYDGTNNPIVDAIGMVIAVSVVLVFWPVLFVQAAKNYLSSPKKTKINRKIG